MVDEQSRYIYDRLSQHASVCGKKVKSSCVVGQSSGTTEGSSFCGHESPNLNDAHVVVVHAPDAVIQALDISLHTHVTHPPT